MIPEPYKPLPYTIAPARGQALLNFEGRRMPDHMPLFEVAKVEEVRPAQGSTDPAAAPNLLLHGDCLSACAYLKSNNIKVDLVYIDPPFASGANFAKTIVLRTGNGAGGAVIEAANSVIGEEVMYSDIWQKEDYLNWIYERLLAIREVMTETASIYVHLDWHIGHYVKLLLDEVFGEGNFRNEIIVRRIKKSIRENEKVRTLNVATDSIFHYVLSEETLITPPTRPVAREERWHGFDAPGIRNGMDYDLFGHKPPPGRHWMRSESIARKWIQDGYLRPNPNSGKPEYKIDATNEMLCDSLWDDISAYSFGNNYITEKSEELLERIIASASDQGMTVADFFSGSGVTADVSFGMGRRFIASDVGLNAIQTTRDRLVSAGASFDVLKIQDGIRLFRNPAQTMAKIFSLVEGFKKRDELELGEFWDGGLPGASGRYIPLKFVGLQERLTPALLDVYLEEIYQLESDDRAEGVRILYAHRDLTVDQAYVNKRLRASGKTQLKVLLVSLNELLDRKAASLFTPDSAVLEVQPAGTGRWEVVVKQYFSPYLKAKIDEFNAKRGKKNGGELIEANGNGDENGNGGTNGNVGETARPSVPFKPVTISDSGLELIEAVQFDTSLREDGVWVSNSALEDKAGPKEKVKGRYLVTAVAFNIKLRNIAGDEIVLDYPPKIPASVA
jgi:adenine-specific DNA-methyltransferase